MPQYLGSSTPLTGSGGATPSYTSRWVLSDFATAITGSVFADQSGTLLIEQSGDGVSVDTDTSVAYTANAVTSNTYNVAIVLPYVRLKFTTGSVTAQTVFRLYSRYQYSTQP